MGKGASWGEVGKLYPAYQKAILDTGFQLELTSRYRNQFAESFVLISPEETIPAAGELIFKLPSKKLNSLRIDASSDAPAKFEIEYAKIWTDGVLKPISLCNDQSMRLIRVEIIEIEGQGCTFQTLTDKPGWISPKGINLDFSEAKNISLVLKMRVTKGSRAKVYWDTGNGYSSKESASVRIQPEDF